MIERSEPEPLSPDDAAILALEGTSITGHTLKVVLVDPGAEGDVLDASELRERVSERVAAVERARQRVEPDGLGAGRPAWIADPAFDVDAHVVAGPRDELDGATLAAELDRLMATRLDHDRPLWRMDVLALEDGGCAIAARFHHAMADGVSCVRLLRSLLWDADATEVRATPTAPPSAAPPATERRRRGDGLRRLPGALGRELGHRSAAMRSFDRALGTRRALAFAETTIAEAKRIEHGAGEGVTVNDVLLAAIGGGVRRWAEREGQPLGPLRVKIPVSLHDRSEGSGTIGNRDSFIFADLDVEEPDPLVRLRAVAASTSERKRDHDADELYRFFHAVSHVRPLAAAIDRRAMDSRTFGLSISNVPGPREPVALLGRRVAALRTVAEPAEHHVLRVAAISLAGGLAIGFCADPDALADIDVLAAGTEAEIEALGRAV